MTGSSLGLRTPSYGSLQQYHQQQQQQQQLLAAVPKQVTPGSIRKQSKMLASGAREKEKLLPWICRLAGRRGVGMLLLAFISLAVFVSILSAFSKDEDVSEEPGMNWKPSQTFHIIPNPPVVLVRPPSLNRDYSHKLNKTFPFETRATSRERELQDYIPFVNKSILPPIHPCENFGFPSPSPDKKRTGPRPCDVCYVPVEPAVAYMPTSPSVSPILNNLTYFSEGNTYMNETNGGSPFSGHPSLQHRNESFYIRESMSVHCGFFKGSRPGIGSGFDIDETDIFEMEKCHGVVIASAIFGNYDILQQPKNVNELTMKTACFYMFVDEETITYIKNSTTSDNDNKVGLWRIVVVRNLPYIDARRNGKVPKLLLHRLFPNARYSLWIDGKLELVVDPYQIIERFLWRKNATFAISRHYRRFDVFVEAEANKAAGKYDNASIDRQIEFYKTEGLTPYSEAKLPITSDVPEGCVIIREHMPITNLFTCLWFNEVDRFTSRDQLSFSTVRDKIMSQVIWNIEMFLDCERRNFVIQAYHRDLLEQMMQSIRPPPPPLLTTRPPRKVLPNAVPRRPDRTPPPFKKPTVRRGRDRRSGPKRRHPKSLIGKDNHSI